MGMRPRALAWLDCLVEAQEPRQQRCRGGRTRVDREHDLLVAEARAVGSARGQHAPRPDEVVERPAHEILVGDRDLEALARLIDALDLQRAAALDLDVRYAAEQPDRLGPRRLRVRRSAGDRARDDAGALHRLLGGELHAAAVAFDLGALDLA